MTDARRCKNAIGILQSVLILGGMMIVGLFIASSVIALTSKDGLTRGGVLWGSVAQNILAFIVPAVLLPCFIGRKPQDWLNYRPRGGWRLYCLIILALIVSLPFMNVIIDYNEAIHFPQSMSSFEETLRRMEEHGSESTRLILENAGLGQMLINVAVVGVLTGIGEEMFFRGGLQNILTKFGVGPGWAICVSAIIFSAAHFQFFGFIPRMLLGGWFGWLYWRYGSIWPAATAHALNNSLVVVSSYGIARGWLPENFEMYGLPFSYTLVVLSMILTFAVIWGTQALYKYSFNNQSE